VDTLGPELVLEDAIAHLDRAVLAQPSAFARPVSPATVKVAVVVPPRIPTANT
jgi:hypothetical protein